ncbi:TVP38/TMEM64 family protein [Pseudonocardia endophytica]|uniref:TVP38/TMEM64 family membrane protein n=1 Tax=Pseudonocardia endophytica TaxID=401976 RepID=A0A4R1HNB7_PSEEN|nr:TVP38/TMEM64 family protein [Pseudonocardia endophytica]TCK22583.1 MYXO-CTERM domain-containing protein [Pseudonocardia endophytica]
MSRAWWIRPAVLVLIVLAGTALLVATGVPSVEEIRAWTAAAGWAAPVVFALLYAAFTLVPAPATVLSIAAGVLFGLPVGLAAAMCGATLGAVVAFGLSRGLGRAAVARIPSERLAWLDGTFSRGGLTAVIGVRLVPVIPFPALNYACGLTGIGLRPYVLGTVVGIVPSATTYTTIGAYGADPGSVPFLLAVGGVAVLVLGGFVVSRRRRRAAAAVPGVPATALDDTRPLDVVR